MNLLEILKKLRALADEVFFIDDDHSYRNIDKPNLKYTSVSGWAKCYYEEFNEEYWALYKALEGSGYLVRKGEIHKDNSESTIFVSNEETSFAEANKLPMNVTPEIIKTNWERKRNKGTTEGTRIHFIYENAWKGKRDSVKYNSIYNIRRKNPHLLLIDTELIVGDVLIGLLGQLDALLYNLETNKFQIRDLKTDDEIKTKNKWQKLKPPFEDLDDCNFNRYVIKINMYRHLLERRIPEMIIDDEMYIDHVSKQTLQHIEYKIPKIELNDDLIRRVIHNNEYDKGE